MDMSYHQKPVRVKVYRLTKDVQYAAPSWLYNRINHGEVEVDEALVDGHVRIYGCTVRTPAGKMKAKIGDYIIMEPDGALSVCKDKRFEQLYQEDTP